MDTTTIIVIVAVAVVAVGAVVAFLVVGRRAQLRRRFGPEYERAVAEGDSRREVEADLRARVDEHRRLDLRELSATERHQYREEWNQVQADFVDRPEHAVGHADDLVSRVMRDRGYPVDDFEHQADLVSVDHPEVVTHYREAHGVFVASRSGEVTTEDRRRALVAYRALFADLLGDPRPQGSPVSDPTDAGAPDPTTDDDRPQSRAAQLREHVR